MGPGGHVGARRGRGPSLRSRHRSSFASRRALPADLVRPGTGAYRRVRRHSQHDTSDGREDLLHEIAVGVDDAPQDLPGLDAVPEPRNFFEQAAPYGRDDPEAGTQTPPD